MSEVIFVFRAPVDLETIERVGQVREALESVRDQGGSGSIVGTAPELEGEPVGQWLTP